jgi:hypothetical protein
VEYVDCYIATGIFALLYVNSYISVNNYIIFQIGPARTPLEVQCSKRVSKNIALRENDLIGVEYKPM